jgi:DNA-binding NtrC family response regulator
MEKILIIEDDKNTLEGLSEILKQEGFEVSGARESKIGLEEIQNNFFDVILTDLMLPDMDGLELTKKIKEISQGSMVIIITAYGSVKNAVQSMKVGAFDYLTKPIDIDELLIIIRRAINEQKLIQENVDLKDKMVSRYRVDNIIGGSGVMQEIFKQVFKVASTDSTVLIRGESGTGKELIARAIHFNSKRKEEPMIEVNCSSLPETLLESELFGYEKGAFTGAVKTKKGRFELADKGTIFLDEIGDISMNVQIKLLRVLQEKRFTRLGGTKDITVDVRVIAATNSDLEKSMHEGRFRDDLYYRLNVIPIVLPPLRDKKEDIPSLIEYFVKKYCEKNNISVKQISPEVVELSMNHDWPGNVRELENAVENAVVMGEKNIIMPEDFPLYLRFKDGINGASLSQLEKGEFSVISEGDLEKQLENAEKYILKKTIDKAGGNKSKAAKMLGISLRNMRYKIKKYNL